MSCIRRKTVDIDSSSLTTQFTEDLIFTFLNTKGFFINPAEHRDEYPAFITSAGGAKAPDPVAHTIGGVQRTLDSFDGQNTEEILSGSFEIPHDYKEGDEIEIHVHWRPSTTGTGTVKWYFDWEYSQANGLPVAQTLISKEVTIASSSQYKHILTAIGVLPHLGYKLGDKIGFNLRRTPSTDTYGDDALFEQVAMHVPIDAFGSRQRYVK